IVRNPEENELCIWEVYFYGKEEYRCMKVSSSHEFGIIRLETNTKDIVLASNGQFVNNQNIDFTHCIPYLSPNYKCLISNFHDIKKYIERQRQFVIESASHSYQTLICKEYINNDIMYFYGYKKSNTFHASACSDNLDLLSKIHHRSVFRYIFLGLLLGCLGSCV